MICSDLITEQVVLTGSGACGRSLELEEAHRLGKENIKDIIACGFDPEKTFIFSDFDYMGGEFYRNIIRLQRCATLQVVLHTSKSPTGCCSRQA